MLKIRSLLLYDIVRVFTRKTRTMGFILSLVDLAMQKLHLLLLLLNLIKSEDSILYITTLFILPILSFFIISRVDKASAADTVDLDSITGLLKSKVNKSLCSHPVADLGGGMGGMHPPPPA